jgi:hypothetical protein
MATATRQNELKKAESVEQALREQRDKAGQRHQSYEARLQDLEQKKAALEAELADIVADTVAGSGDLPARAAAVRSDIAKAAAEIEAVEQLRDAAQVRHQAAAAAHEPAALAVLEAQKVARREECELLLMRLDEAFRQVETAWSNAAAAAHALREDERFQDHWAEDVLMSIRIAMDKQDAELGESYRWRLTLPRVADQRPITS